MLKHIGDWGGMVVVEGFENAKMSHHVERIRCNNESNA